MCELFDVQQLFAAGIGFDLAGAGLLVKGLLSSPRDLALKSGSYYNSNPHLGVSVARDKVDALTGLVTLGVGFALQAIGYVVVTAGASSSGSAKKALVSALLIALAGSCTLLFWWVGREQRIKRLLVEMARIDLQTEEGHRLDLPLGGKLQTLGEVLGYELRTGEDSLAYLRRVFGVRDALYGTSGNYQRGSEMKSEPE